MRNYLAVVFDSTSKAYEGLHALWDLDLFGEITIHGTTVVHRTVLGQMRVDTKETHPALATEVGIGIGALIGLLAGPAGIAVGVAAGAALGAAAGGVVGAIADVDRADMGGRAMIATGFVLGPGQAAVIADVSEDWTAPADIKMKELGGALYRRDRSALRDDGLFSDAFLYPYEYTPAHSVYDW